MKLNITEKIGSLQYEVKKMLDLRGVFWVGKNTIAGVSERPHPFSENSTYYFFKCGNSLHFPFVN